MTKLNIWFAMLLCIALSTQSCKKNNTIEPERISINSTIRLNNSYEYELGGFGDEEGATITKQASHFSLSALERLSAGNIIYNYTPSINFVGTDEIEIRSARGSNGASANNKIILTTIKITVTN